MAYEQMQVGFVVFPEASLLDIAGSLEVFNTAADVVAEDGGARPYALRTLSTAGGLVVTSSGLAIETTALTGARDAFDTFLVVGGRGVHAAKRDRALLDWVVDTACAARRICSVCTGAYVLATAGLLDGRRATTHWRWCAHFQGEFPKIEVEPDPIFIKDGRVWTSAGVTAGIDLALSLVEDDLGRHVATAVARRLVVFARRPGGQSQFSALMALQTVEGADDFEALHAWMRENLAGDLRVERLAEQARMSPRSFARHYARRVGRTPAKTVEALRLEAARCALEETVAPVKQIAGACGFGNEERMRRAFLRRLQVSPVDYRGRFGQGAARPPAE